MLIVDGTDPHVDVLYVLVCVTQSLNSGGEVAVDTSVQRVRVLVPLTDTGINHVFDDALVNAQVVCFCECAHWSVYLRVIPTASLSTLPSGFPIFSMVSIGVARKNISASMSACCTFWISSCVMSVSVEGVSAITAERVNVSVFTTHYRIAVRTIYFVHAHKIDHLCGAALA